MPSKNHRFEDRSPVEIRARKIKLAETGILFVLVVGICVYLGIRFAHQPLDGPAVTVRTAPVHTAAVGHDALERAVVNDLQEPVWTQTAEPAAEPVGTLGTSPETPIYVTFTGAEKMYFEGRFDEAAHMFAAYCDQHPDNTWGHYMRGLSLWKAGRATEARIALETALRLQPDHLKSLINLARVALDLSEADAALVAVERALDIAPHDVEALRVLGRIYHRLERSDDAASAYLEALRLKADDAWSLNNLGLIYIEREEFDLALPALARACALAPDVAVMRNNLGTALERTGYPGQAVIEFELAAVLGSARGEENYDRLRATSLAPDAPEADLLALAAQWKLPQEGSAELAAIADSSAPGNGP